MLFFARIVYYAFAATFLLWCRKTKAPINGFSQFCYCTSATTFFAAGVVARANEGPRGTTAEAGTETERGKEKWKRKQKESEKEEA